jgi:predicted nucleic acid-binding protein
VAETANILWKKLQRGELPDGRLQEVGAILADPNRFPVNLISGQRLVSQALEIARDFRRSVYDALYLSAAIDADADLVTADERLVNAVGASSFWRGRVLLI